MSIFKDELTGWFSPIATDGKYDLKSLSKSIKLLIGVNTSEQTTYTGYLIALFSIFVPIYIALIEFKFHLLVYLIIIELNLIFLIVLLRKMKNLNECNEMMIEQYNAIQSQFGGSFLVKIKGKKEDVLKQVSKWNKQFHFKPVNVKSHELNNEKKNN